MHPYSTDSTRLRTVLLGLAVAAILLAWGLGRALQSLAIEPPWWLDTPAVAGFYGILWQLYDRCLWHLPAGRATLSGIPDYRGTWIGRVHSSFDTTKVYPATLTIRQTSSRILVELATETSRSVSHMAMLCGAAGSEEGLQYLYTNRPRGEPPAPAGAAVRAMTIHEGVCRLLLSEDRSTVDGDYQNDRHRQTYGTLKLRREAAK